LKRFFPKARLKWKEPGAFRRIKRELEKRTISPWFQPGVAVFQSVFLLGMWWSARFNPSKHPPPFQVALPLAIGFGLFCAYGIPWIYRLCPSYVQVFDEYVSRSAGSATSIWKFRDIERSEILTITKDRMCHSVLVLYKVDGRKILVGMEEGVADQLHRLLIELGVVVERKDSRIVT